MAINLVLAPDYLIERSPHAGYIFKVT